MTTETVTLEDLQGTFSDLFKDVYGFRPRGYGCWNDAEALKAEIESLYVELDHVIAREKEQEEIAVAAFEKRVAETITMGAGTREDAIRWIAQGMGDADPDSVCYELGLPFGYLGKQYLYEESVDTE